MSDAILRDDGILESLSQSAIRYFSNLTNLPKFTGEIGEIG